MDQLGASQFAGNVRFQVAKNQIDQLFVKWLSLGTTDKLINSLINSIHEPDQQIQKAPPPLFVVSSIATPHSPKGGPRGHTPPRSPSGEKYLGRTLSPKTSGSLFDYHAGKPGTLHQDSGFGQNSTTLTSSFEASEQSQKSQHGQMGGSSSAFPQNQNQQMPYNKNFAKTDTAALQQMIGAGQQMNGAPAATAQDVFYPRQKRGGQEEESKAIRQSATDQAQKAASPQISNSQAARENLQQAALQSQQQVSQTPQPVRSSKLGQDNNGGLGSGSAHQQLQDQHQTLQHDNRVRPGGSGPGSLTNTRNQPNQRLDSSASTEIVPQFYFPQGKPVSQDTMTQFNESIEKVFGKSTGKSLAADEFGPVCTDIFGYPKIFSDMLFTRLEQKFGPLPKLGGKAKVNKQIVIRYWEACDFYRKDPKRRLFELLCKDGADTIVGDDFKPMFKHLLEKHPGLEFLQQTPEFQERYADTVVMRIFYGLDTNDDGKITFRDFKNSDLFETLNVVSNEEDINKVRQYFSYEHFYVLYCRFWELDTDHDFLIDKEDFSRYEGHALSRKAVDRIFDQVPRKFRSSQEGKMGYEDFVWFMLSEEDKTTLRALQFWYKVIDLDENGVITPHEMDYFYEEQVHRLEYLNHEPILFVDLLCQMNDMIKPKPTEGHFTLDQLRQYITQVGIFFNCLVNLNKFIAYETRDLFAIKHQLTEFPDYTEWDRFAKNEYERLAMEEEGGDDSEMIDAMDGWDSEEDSSAAQGAGGDSNKDGAASTAASSAVGGAADKGQEGS